MLENRHLFYPDALTPADVVAKVKDCLNMATANRDVLCDPRMDWENYIQRVCLEYGVHPIMPLVAMQRERSLLGKQAESEQDFNFALGVVGQDTPGTVNERWNGLPTQILLAVRTMAWLADIGPASNFGFRPGIAPTHERWNYKTQNLVRLYNSDSTPGGLANCPEQATYVQLCFTPHLEVLDTNRLIYDRWFKRFWE